MVGSNLRKFNKSIYDERHRQKMEGEQTEIV